jgi:DNA-binding NtrC family response regulator
MVVLAKSDLLDVGELPAAIRGSVPVPEGSGPRNLNLKLVEKELIQDALKRSRANKTEAARLLGLSRRTLYRKMHEYGLDLSGEH